jgi:hypothetical protein
MNSLADLYQGTNALGAQQLSNFSTIFENADSLQIRLEGALGCLFRPGTIATKGGLFSAMITFCHNCTSFSFVSGQLWPIFTLQTAVLATSYRQTAAQVYHTIIPNTSGGGT